MPEEDAPKRKRSKVIPKIDHNGTLHHYECSSVENETPCEMSCGKTMDPYFDSIAITERVAHVENRHRSNKS